MVHYLKESALSVLEHVGASRQVGRSAWRRRRLLILCYHGVSLTNEHEWAPGLYVSPAHLEERLTLVRNEGCTVLPLGQAVDALYAGELPERAVALTFDDGYHDFAVRAWPILRQFGYPATLYLTTARVDRNLPNVNLFISYALWCGRGRDFDARGFLGLTGRYPLQTSAERDAAFVALTRALRTNRTRGISQDHLARIVVERLGLDYEALLASRVLTLMRPEEISQLAAQGLDVQMHTHLHRSPPDPEEFVRDVLVNRDRIEQLTGIRPIHFCYPSGNYRYEYVAALRHAGIRTATTCDPGMATSDQDPLLLPRFIDTSGVPSIIFRSWLTGMAECLPRRTRRGGDPRPLGPQLPSPVTETRSSVT
jgi:peptidoglycan/xylan/chitin deacetylase (PgdA/CDA1 family)